MSQKIQTYYANLTIFFSLHKKNIIINVKEN